MELCASSPQILRLEWTAGPEAAALVAVDGAAAGCVARSQTSKTQIRVQLANGVHRLSVHRFLGEMPLPDVLLEREECGDDPPLTGVLGTENKAAVVFHERRFPQFPLAF